MRKRKKSKLYLLYSAFGVNAGEVEVVRAFDGKQINDEAGYYRFCLVKGKLSDEVKEAVIDANYSEQQPKVAGARYFNRGFACETKNGNTMFKQYTALDV